MGDRCENCGELMQWGVKQALKIDLAQAKAIIEELHTKMIEMDTNLNFGDLYAQTCDELNTANANLAKVVEAIESLPCECLEFIHNIHGVFPSKKCNRCKALKLAKGS